jgi:hypothetical protein
MLSSRAAELTCRNLQCCCAMMRPAMLAACACAPVLHDQLIAAELCGYASRRSSSYFKPRLQQLSSQTRQQLLRIATQQACAASCHTLSALLTPHT